MSSGSDSSSQTVSFLPFSGNVKEDGTVQIRVEEEMDDDVEKRVELTLLARSNQSEGQSSESDEKAKSTESFSPMGFYALRVKSGLPRVSGLEMSGLVERGPLPLKCELKFVCGEAILDDMSKRYGVSSPAAAASASAAGSGAGAGGGTKKKKKKRKRLAKDYVVVFEAVGVPSMPSGSMKDFWRRAAEGEFGAMAEQTLTLCVKEKKRAKDTSALSPNFKGSGSGEGTAGEGGDSEDGSTDYFALSLLIFSLLFAVYIFLQPIPEEVLPPCNATLNITDHCINETALNHTSNNSTGIKDELNDSEPALDSSFYDGENDEDEDEYQYVYKQDVQKDAHEGEDVDDEDDADYSVPTDHKHGELRRRL